MEFPAIDAMIAREQKEQHAKMGKPSAASAGYDVTKQTHEIMAGRRKNGNIFIQIEGRAIEFKEDLLDSLIAGLLMAKS